MLRSDDRENNVFVDRAKGSISAFIKNDAIDGLNLATSSILSGELYARGILVYFYDSNSVDKNSEPMLVLSVRRGDIKVEDALMQLYQGLKELTSYDAVKAAIKKTNEEKISLVRQIIGNLPKQGPIIEKLEANRKGAWVMNSIIDRSDLVKEPKLFLDV